MDEDWYLGRAVGDVGWCRTVGLFPDEPSAAAAVLGLPDGEVVRFTLDSLIDEAYLPCNGRCLSAEEAGLPFGDSMVFPDRRCPRHSPDLPHMFTPVAGQGGVTCASCGRPWSEH